MTKKEVTLSETMQNIEKAINVNPEPISGIQYIYQFDISGKEEGTYQLHLKDGLAKVIEGEDSASECTLIMSLDNFYKFLTGSLNGTMAFMTGKLKIKGDMTKALKLEALLKQYNLSEYVEV